MTTKLAAPDPYKFMALIDTRVIHPGGRTPTESLLRRAEDHAVEPGAGLRLWSRHYRGAPRHPVRRQGHRRGHLTLMLGGAQATVRAASAADRVTVEPADISNSRMTTRASTSSAPRPTPRSSTAGAPRANWHE
jgi:hypothetical protein